MGKRHDHRTDKDGKEMIGTFIDEHPLYSLLIIMAFVITIVFVYSAIYDRHKRNKLEMALRSKGVPEDQLDEMVEIEQDKQDRQDQLDSNISVIEEELPGSSGFKYISTYYTSLKWRDKYYLMYAYDCHPDGADVKCRSLVEITEEQYNGY